MWGNIYFWYMTNYFLSLFEELLHALHVFHFLSVFRSVLQVATYFSYNVFFYCQRCKFLKFLSVLETPSPLIKSSDDMIGDSDDERADIVKRKVCHCTYMILTTK